MEQYDVAVVGGGILGLACAYRASVRGLRVAVFERNASCVGASIRNFGFVTVTGQKAGAHWARAMKSRNIWQTVAAQAGIDVIHQGIHFLARSPEACDVLEAFMKTEMGEDCRFLSSNEITRDLPYLQSGEAVMYSPHELRVESKVAVGQLADWLSGQRNIDIYYNTSVSGVELPNVLTARGKFGSRCVLVCPGDDKTSLYADVIAKAQARKCSLQMLRLRPSPGFLLKSSVMSDMTLARYEGFAALPEAAALSKKLDQEQSFARQKGIHLIVVQSQDGSLVVGDSHVYGENFDPFRDENIDRAMIEEYLRVFKGEVVVEERWMGCYLSADEVVFKARPETDVVVGLITSGTGASTAFAFADELLDEVL